MLAALREALERLPWDGLAWEPHSAAVCEPATESHAHRTPLTRVRGPADHDGVSSAATST
jgi:hypothetical protein